jgi:hypothetical protein
MIKRLIQIKEGVIGGFEKELIERILPQLVGSFRQRKEFFEYYFDEKWILLSIEDIENISRDFAIEISEFELEIKVN